MAAARGAGTVGGACHTLRKKGKRDRGREGGRERGKEGGSEGGKEGVMEGGREGAYFGRVFVDQHAIE